jgi:hypothetical protein
MCGRVTGTQAGSGRVHSRLTRAVRACQTPRLGDAPRTAFDSQEDRHEDIQYRPLVGRCLTCVLSDLVL